MSAAPDPATVDDALVEVRTQAMRAAGRVLPDAFRNGGWHLDVIVDAVLAVPVLAARLHLGGPSGVLAEVAAERRRQDAKWGEHSHPDLGEGAWRYGGGATAFYGLPTASVARSHCQAEHRFGHGGWLSIAVEEWAEVAEAAEQGDQTSLRRELVQGAAVAVAWIEAIDRRAARPAAATDTTQETHRG